MPSSTKRPSTRFNAILLVSAMLAAGGATAAFAQDRCTGTLCDWYYGSSAPSTEDQSVAKPAAPTPLMVPTFKSLFSGGATQQANGQGAAAPAMPSRLRIGGGGLAAVARGETSGRCSGTLCDLYYGSSAPEPEEEAAAAPTAAAAPAPEAAAEPPPGVRYERVAEHEAKPRCAYSAQDPWKCYR